MNRSISLQKKYKYEFLGIGFISLALLILVALYSPQVGVVTNLLEKLLRCTTGQGRYLFPLFFAYIGMRLIQKPPDMRSSIRLYGGMIIFLVGLTLIHVFYPLEQIWSKGIQGLGGGVIGAFFALILLRSFGLLGSCIVIFACALIGILLLFHCHLTGLYQYVTGKLHLVWKKLKQGLIDFLFEEVPFEEEKMPLQQAKGKKETDLLVLDFACETTQEEDSNPQEQEDVETKNNPPITSEVTSGGPTLRLVKPAANNTGQAFIPKDEVMLPEAFLPKENQYSLPRLSLLNKPIPQKNGKATKDIAENVRRLEEVLGNFGIQAKVNQVSRGPAITRYEIHPPAGVKVSRIVNLADDIALAMAAADVRIEAPIPGKAAVGIEVPNQEIATVHLRELLETEAFQKTSSGLTIALGKDIAGSPVVADMTCMPHLLIAGATGAGKSVCLNTILASMLFKATPDQLKFLIIDPKMVELATYNGIPHLISPVVTDPKKAATALRWAVKEMESRYALFAKTGVRDIVRYNGMMAKAEEEKAFLPYIVVIVDELADLMMVAPADVEDAICRLAQMARAAGIHLMIATQRPSVDVITGLIKANIPSRVSFAVSSQIDSRTILDMGGAEKLLGKGDMLFFPVGAAKPLRIQGAYLSDAEVERLVEYWKKQAIPEYQENLTEEDAIQLQRDEVEDELLPRAVELLIETGHASISMLQRRLHIGYARAARLIDVMERKGIVGSFEGSKPRTVLMTLEEYQDTFKKVENKM